MFSKYKLNQVPIWGAYYDPIKQIDSIPIMDEEEITNVDMRLTWDSENRLKQVSNNSHDARYLYDSSGQRVLKRGNRTEIVYPTQFIQLDRAKKLYTKHIFLGTTRISSKLCSITNYFKDIEFEKRNNYTYHPDHLGSTSFVSDFRGEVYEYYQYTPYGEIWAEKSDILDKITHLFTSKELDAESGFYYFGARYLEPMTSRWLSCDPILDDYLPSGNKERDKNLPGMGGVFNHYNINLYHYSANNPLKYTDPDGMEVGDRFNSIDEAAKDFSKCYNDDSIKDNKEYSTTIYKSNKVIDDTDGTSIIVIEYYYTIPIKGTSSGTAYENLENNIDQAVATAHTHAAYHPDYGSGNDNFSPDDRRIANSFNLPNYVSTPSGDFKRYDPGSLNTRGKQLANFRDGIPTDPNHPNYSSIPPYIRKPGYTYKKSPSRSGTLLEYYRTHIGTRF